MNIRLEDIIASEAWTSKEIDALKAACSEDPSLARQLSHWKAVIDATGAAFRERLPDSEALVLLALADVVEPNQFSDDERRLIDALRRDDFGSSTDDAVASILNRIRGEADSFEAVWQDAMEPAPTTTKAPDRRPIAPLTERARRTPLRAVMDLSPVVRWSYGIAAALAVTVIAVALVARMSTTPDVWSYRADAGQVHIVNLPDGSSVRLVDGAVLSHAVDGNAFDRNVALEGNAYFDVSEGDARFTVTTSNAVVSVFGTRFGVSSNAAESITEVVLVSGSVHFASRADTSSGVFLSPGQSSRVVLRAHPGIPSGVDVDRALAWTDLFIFRDTPINEVVRRLSESFDIPIVVDEKVGDISVTGTFDRLQGLQAILEAVTSAVGLRFESLDDDGGFRITG